MRDIIAQVFVLNAYWSAMTPVVADGTEAKSGDFALRKVITDFRMMN